MDRLPRAGESIVDKAPIVISAEAARGYTGIRTTIQLRDLRFAKTGEDPDQFSIDAVINTELRKGPRVPRQTELQDQITQHHRELGELLLKAIADHR